MRNLIAAITLCLLLAVPSAAAYADDHVVLALVDSRNTAELPIVEAEVLLQDEAPTTTVAPPVDDTTVDLAPVWKTVTEMLNFALLGVASVVAMWARSWFKISSESAMNQALHAALQRGVSIATTAVAEQLNKIPDPQIQNAIARAAAQYVIDNRGAAVDYFKLDKERLEELAKAYLPKPNLT